MFQFLVYFGLQDEMAGICGKIAHCTTTNNLLSGTHTAPMALYELLQDRLAINVLKVLHENELQKAYAVKLAEIQQQFQITQVPAAAQHLVSAGLANADAVEHDAVLTITEKGKQFISIFDQLVALSNGSGVAKKSSGMSIQYGLTPVEQRVLATAAQVIASSGKPAASLHALARALYPDEESKKKVSGIAKQVQQLEGIGLVSTEQIGKHILVRVTENGKRTIQEQHLSS